MDLEYYTIEQAARRLDCHTDEIEHLLETDRLQPHLYAKSRKFLIIDGERVGRGIALYTGLLRTHRTNIITLLHKKQVLIKSPVRLANPKGIQTFWGEHSYRSDLFLSSLELSGWKGFSQEVWQKARELSALAGIPLPLEHIGGMRAFGKMMQTIAETMERQGNQLPVNSRISPDEFPEYSYSFDPNGKFELSDLRITHADLMATGASAGPSSSSKKEPEKNEPHAPPIVLSGKRTHDLHNLLLRILAKSPELTTNDIWNILKRESQSTPRNCDEDEILQYVDSEKLVWVSRHGHQQTLKRTSLSATLSALRKRAGLKAKN